MDQSTQRILSLLKELEWPMLYETGAGHEFISDNFFLYTGYYAEEVMHNRDFFPSRIHPEDIPEINHSVSEWHKQNEPGILVQVFRLKNVYNDNIWMEDYISEVKRPDKKFMRGLMIVCNEEKKREIELLGKRFLLQKTLRYQESELNEINAELSVLKQLSDKRVQLVDELFALILKHDLLLEQVYLHHAPNRY